MADSHGVNSAVVAHEAGGRLPDDLYQAIRGYMPSRCILSALELDLFTCIGEGATAAEIARNAGADARGTEVLLNALVAVELLTWDGELYRNADEAARFFSRNSPDSQRDGLLHAANIWHHWSTLTDVVKKGHRFSAAGDGVADRTRDFIRAMNQNARERAPHLVEALGTAGVRRVLDLGGGSGIYSIAFAKASAEIECEILDLAQVAPLTREYVEKAGVSEQVRVRTGNMLEGEFGGGYDLVMLNAICHMFTADQNQRLIRRARKALSPNGRLAVQDFILNPDRCGPLHAVLFSVNMLVGTEGGACYSESEYKSWMEDAGLGAVQRIDLPGPSDLMVGQVS